MTHWPPLPPDTDAPITARIFREHLLVIHTRVDARRADTRRLEVKIDRLCDGIQRLSSIRAWITGGSAALGAGAAYAVAQWLQNGGHL